MSPRLLVADPSPVFRDSLRNLLRAEAPRWRIVGEAASGTEVLAGARDLEPDAVLLERCLGDDDGLRLLPELREACPAAAVLMISFDWEPAVRRVALERGASDTLLKQDVADHLVRTLREVRAESGREPDPGSGPPRDRG